MICEDTLETGGYKFSCPACELELTVIMVRHILSSVMTGEELNAMLDRMNENFVNRPDTDIRQCQVCAVNWKRDFSKSWPGHRDRVVCNTCSRTQGKEVEYCWGCRRVWRGDNSKCGYSDCNWEKAQINTLQKCGTKKIGDVPGCPIIRACPRCGTLIHHKEGCKHMTCKCGCDFCFVCLKEKKSPNWECTPYDSTCPIAPRQTVIPGSEATIPDQTASLRQENNLPVQRRGLLELLFSSYPFSWFVRWFR